MAKKQQVYWSWKDEEIEIFGEDGKSIFVCHPRFYVDHKRVLSYFSKGIYTFSTPWEMAKAFTDEHGITPTNVAKKFNGIRYHEVISRHPEWMQVVQTKKGRIKPELFETIESVDLVEQAIKDGLKNITPFIVLHNSSPQELKKLFGSNNWKTLCKNSYSRNRLICLASLSTQSRNTLNFMQYPSTLLKNKWYQRDFAAIKLALKVAGCSMAKMDATENIRTIVRVCDTWSDTKRMCEARGIAFNPNWSWRRIQEEHHNLQTEQQREYQRMRAELDSEYAKLLAVDFRTLHKFLEPMVFESGVVATPLVDMQQVQDEGQKMKHCVGGYSQECARGSYVVWHLTKGKEDATLGINCYGPNVRIEGKEHRAVQYKFSQMYHECNRAVEDQDFVQAAQEIIDKMNKAAKIQVTQ